MSGTSFNVMGNSILKEVLAYGSDAEIRGSVINSNPLFLTDGEKETLSSNKGDWLLMDGTCLMCGVESADSVDAELESLSKFMKKTWNRKIMFVSMRPSTFCACGPSVRPMPGYKPYLGAAEISTKLLNTLNCYIISLPFECISRDGKPYHYIPRIIEYIRSVIDVITVKCDRNAIDKLSLACSIDLRRMICTDVVEKPVSNTAKEDLRKAYYEAMAEGKKAKACAICADLVSMGDMWAAPLAEKSYQAANKVCSDDGAKIGWLRKFACSGMDWAKPILFDLLWKAKTPETDAEMVKVVCGMTRRGESAAMKRLSRAYREGRGVKVDLDKAAELAQRNYDAGVQGANIDLFDTLWKMGTPEAYDKMVSLVKGPAADGDLGSMVRMARAYREGRGVPKDVKEAVSILEKVVAEKPAFRKELENTRKLVKD